MEIRRIEPRDFTTVAALENENWISASTPVDVDSTAENIIGKVLKGASYLLAVEDEKILGVLDYSPRHSHKNGQAVLTFGVMTIKEARNRGIARRLILHFLEFAKNKDYQKISIEVLSTNPSAISLYESLGFTREGLQKAEFFIDGKSVDNLLYAYFLNQK